MCRNYVVLCFAFLFIACSSDIDRLNPVLEESQFTLATAIADREVVLDNVIACAASNEDPAVVSVFLYPREGATNISFYQADASVDKNDFTNYTRGNAELLDVFNGFLLKYEISPEQEQWVIVSFEEEGQLHLSNPIRLKQLTKPTEYLDQNVQVDTSSMMPIFSWEDGTFDDSIIYFHVVSDTANNLFSGTYTFDRTFQYYNLDNVVLNITEVVPPPELQDNTDYNFTLLAVSEDNWVNLFAERPFTIEVR